MENKNSEMNLSQELAEQIGQVTEYQIDELMLLALRRFYQLRPDWEGMFLVLSTDPARRKEEIKQMIRHMSDLYGVSSGN